MGDFIEVDGLRVGVHWVKHAVEELRELDALRTRLAAVEAERDRLCADAATNERLWAVRTQFDNANNTAFHEVCTERDSWKARAEAAEAERDRLRSERDHYREVYVLARRATAEEIAAWLEQLDDSTAREWKLAANIRAKWCGKEGK